MRYKIQQRISTLAENAVMIEGDSPYFEIVGITFTHWEFDRADGWIGDAWFAEFETEADKGKLALQEFNKRLFKVMPIIALIGQTYMQYLAQPRLIINQELDIGHFYYVFDKGPTGLMFQENEKRALDLLLQDKKVPEEFYLYWNDAVNTSGYSGKLLVMFSALYALAKKPNGDTDFDLLERILGKELKEELFTRHTGLRHRLIHGDYFSDEDTENMLELVHKKVIHYFNEEILTSNLIEENIVGPQRHFLNNDLFTKLWVKSESDDWPLNLKTLIKNCEQNDNHPKDYKLLNDEEADGF